MKRTWLIVFGDFLSFLISFGILIFIRFKPQEYRQAISMHTAPFIVLYLTWVLIFYTFGLYDLLNIKPNILYLKKWILALITSFTVGMLLFYFIPSFGIAPKINLIIQVIGFGIFSFFIRRIIYNFFAKTISQPAVLVGNSASLSELEKIISGNPQIGLNIIKKFQDINEININNLSGSTIILDQKPEILNQNILSLYSNGIDITDTAKAYEKYLYKIPVEYIDINFIIENINLKKDIFYKFVTYLLNIIFAIIVLIITSPIMFIAITARLLEDGRPIFIKQKRVGLNGKNFNLYKLRSMIVLSKDGSAETKDAVWSTGKDDTRITPVGKILRKTHIDEIPQMINILKGDITLVGPRPERPEFVEVLEKEIPYYSFRHIIKPGFTGWAQIKYRYANTTESSREKFEYDLYYIKNRNIFIDIGIIIRTIQIIFTH